MTPRDGLGELEHGLDEAYRISLTVRRGFLLCRNRATASALARALAQVDDRTEDADAAELLRRAVNRTLVVAARCDLPAAVVYQLGWVSMHARDPVLAGGGPNALRAAGQLVRALERTLEAVRSMPRTGRTEGLAGRVLRWSLWPLPASERLRYRDELEAELHELRAEPRRRQVGYAVRLLVRSPGLRRALRTPPAGAPAKGR